jgi:hypothetical protein
MSRSVRVVAKSANPAAARGTAGKPDGPRTARVGFASRPCSHQPGERIDSGWIIAVVLRASIMPIGLVWLRRLASHCDTETCDVRTILAVDPAAWPCLRSQRDSPALQASVVSSPRRNCESGKAPRLGHEQASCRAQVIRVSLRPGGAGGVCRVAGQPSCSPREIDAAVN